VPGSFFDEIAARYARVVTIEDGLIGNPDSGLRGFAGLAASHLAGRGPSLAHLGITDPQIAPSDDYRKVWDHFGMTAEALLAAILSPHANK